MTSKPWTMTFLLIAVLLLSGSWEMVYSATTSPPANAVKLIFIHHSTGENWLADENGGLGLALRNNNYFVSDTNYGWGPGAIGDLTDIGYWWTWFCGSQSSTYLSALYSESGQNSGGYSRLAADPGGENEIVLFKSCFPNSHLGGSSSAPATTGQNPLRGQDASSEYMTVANAKGIYNDLLTYFVTRQDKLFIAITAPPLGANDTDADHAANARAFNNWLVNDWLDTYPYNNVAVFDFYNVLTSNAGNASQNDAGTATGNHHRWWNNAVQHLQTVAYNMAAYPSDAWDSHPTAAGNQKATTEFVPLLNYYYSRWEETTAPSHRYYLPYYTEASGYWTGIALANCSSTNAAHITLTYYDQNGTAAGTDGVTIAADGQNAFVAGCGTIQQGWILITSDQPLLGFSLFGTTGPGNYFADMPLADTPGTILHLPHVAQNANFDTTIFLCNPNSSAVTVGITLVTREGAAGPLQWQTIPALGNRTVPLSQFLGGAPSISGKMKLWASQGIVAFALYTNVKSGGAGYVGIWAEPPAGQ